jgi:uncharacterized membrane protein YjjB (DUF3815 family)
VNRIKFEYLFAFVIVLVLAGALVLFRNDADIRNIIITALVGALSAVTAYFFTKHNPNK